MCLEIKNREILQFICFFKNYLCLGVLFVLYHVYISPSIYMLLSNSPYFLKIAVFKYFSHQETFTFNNFFLYVK